MNIDHVVLWVDDPKRSLKFYVEVLAMLPVREQEFSEGKAPFPSVRLNDETIIDLMDKRMLSAAQDFTGGEAGGYPINHVCLCVNKEEYVELKSRLTERGVVLSSAGGKSFGAQGYTNHSEYFQDPDHNIIEIRYYD